MKTRQMMVVTDFEYDPWKKKNDINCQGGHASLEHSLYAFFHKLIHGPRFTEPLVTGPVLGGPGESGRRRVQPKVR